MKEILDNIKEAAKAVTESTEEVNKSISSTLFGAQKKAEYQSVPKIELELIYEDLQSSLVDLTKWINQHRLKDRSKVEERRLVIDAQLYLIKSCDSLLNQLRDNEYNKKEGRT